jgi:hypothetical protein
LKPTGEDASSDTEAACDYSDELADLFEEWGGEATVLDRCLMKTRQASFGKKNVCQNILCRGRKESPRV